MLLCLCAGGLWWLLVIFCFCFISGFAGCLPVVSCVLALKSLNINTIHLSGMHAFSGWVCLSEPLIYLIRLIHMKWVDMLVCCGYIRSIVHFWFCRCFAGVLPVFSCVLTLNSLIINTIHFCWFVCNCRLVGYIFGEFGLWWLQRLTLLIRRSETGCRACRRYNLRQTKFSGCGLLYCPEIS